MLFLFANDDLLRGSSLTILAAHFAATSVVLSSGMNRTSCKAHSQDARFSNTRTLYWIMPENGTGCENAGHEHTMVYPFYSVEGNLAYVRTDPNSTVKTTVAVGLAFLAAEHIGSGCGILKAGACGGSPG